MEEGLVLGALAQRGDFTLAYKLCRSAEYPAFED